MRNFLKNPRRRGEEWPPRQLGGISLRVSYAMIFMWLFLSLSYIIVGAIFIDNGNSKCLCNSVCQMWRNLDPLDVKLASLPRTMENVSGSYSMEPPLKGTEENHFVMSITRYLMIFTRYLDTFKESSGHFWISQVDEGILQELQRAAEMQTAEMQVPWDSSNLLGYLQNAGHLTILVD